MGSIGLTSSSRAQPPVRVGGVLDAQLKFGPWHKLGKIIRWHVRVRHVAKRHLASGDGLLERPVDAQEVFGPCRAAHARANAEFARLSVPRRAGPVSMTPIPRVISRA